MSKSSLRDRQVQDNLNRYRKVSSLIADAVRRGVRSYEPVLDPVRREQLNMLDILNVGEYINQFKITFSDKLNIFDNVFNTKPTDRGKPEFASGVDKLTDFLSDMIDYNRVIQVYLNMSNTPQTRIEMFNKKSTLEETI